MRGSDVLHGTEKARKFKEEKPKIRSPESNQVFIYVKNKQRKKVNVNPSL